MDDLLEMCCSKQKYDKSSSSPMLSSGTKKKKKKAAVRKVKIDDDDDDLFDGPSPSSRGGLKRGRSYDDDFDAGEYVPRQSTSRSTRSSPSMTDEADARPKKKRKVEPAKPAVSVLKVPPSAFPKELYEGKNMDPSTEEDLNRVFTPQGSFPLDAAKKGKEQKYQDRAEFVVEGHFYNCAACLQDMAPDAPERCCCRKCPRAYHEKCFEESSSSAGADDTGHKQRECKRCELDKQITPVEATEKTVVASKKIQEAYAQYKGVASHAFSGNVLSDILQILEKLTAYDYGHVFADPGEFMLFSHV